MLTRISHFILFQSMTSILEGKFLVMFGLYSSIIPLPSHKCPDFYASTNLSGIWSTFSPCHWIFYSLMKHHAYVYFYLFIRIHSNLWPLDWSLSLSAAFQQVLLPQSLSKAPAGALSRRHSHAVMCRGSSTKWFIFWPPLIPWATWRLRYWLFLSLSSIYAPFHLYFWIAFLWLLPKDPQLTHPC